MATREQFGSYLLLKKLGEDPLGETFRAGRLGSQGVDQVVLLRVFNGVGVDGEGLWQQIGSRGPVLDALKSPNLGNGVDLGQVGGVPYVAYDYVSGKTLASLLEQAERSSNPVPTDHALLIAERVAIGLAVAYETRVADQRVLHGMLAPQLVMLSNEGETRTLGFESAAALRTFAASKAAFARYLSPETRAGAPLSKQDDVYSLGVLLLELLTGKPLPPPAGGEFGGVVDAARLAAEGSPLPPEIAGLIKRSLSPRDSRISDVVTWHRTLSKLMAEGQFNPTTFNLAFFMHNLFKDDIERESQEIEAEQTMEIPAAAIAGTVQIPQEEIEAASGFGDDTGTEAVRRRYDMPEKKEEEKSRKPIWIALAALLLLGLAGAGGWWYFLGPGANTGEEEPEQVATLPLPTTEESAVDPLSTDLTGDEALLDGAAEGEAGEGEDGEEPPSEEEAIRLQIEQMLAERTAAMEASLRAQYDARVTELQTMLEDAQEQEAAQAEADLIEEGTTGEAPTQVADLTAGDEVADPAADVPAEAEPEQVAQVSPQAAEPEPVITEPPPKPEPPPVRVGDLVRLGPGVVPPRLTRPPTPRFPVMAQRLNKQAVVPVRVLVNENGGVDKVELGDRKFGFGFDEAALEAARSAQYQAATKNGVRVKIWTTLKIQFTN